MPTNKQEAKRVRGFTLVELLTVVAIIGLLVGMVVPTIRAVLENSQRMKMLVRVHSLDTGARTYKMSGTGNRYYPGQDTEGISGLEGNSSKYPNCQNAGSALLAQCLFTDPNGRFPVSAYGTYEDDLLDTSEDPITGVPYSILDADSETMAVLYYPSRIGEKGSTTQYRASDNSKYTDASGGVDQVADAPTGSGKMNIQMYVQQTTSLPISMDGEFVITAAGSDRLYFSTTGVNNFSK
jgi:prepilin-type N-terminal cleavage/methylation domain-containing protein